MQTTPVKGGFRRNEVRYACFTPKGKCGKMKLRETVCSYHAMGFGHPIPKKRPASALPQVAFSTGSGSMRLKVR
jgi:hypothetical protein